jgi:hypothetical protein
MEGKELNNIWPVFGILELEMNFDSTICVTCILCWHSGNFQFAVQIQIWLSKLHTLTTGRLYIQNSLVTAHFFMSTDAVAK